MRTGLKRYATDIYGKGFGARSVEMFERTKETQAICLCTRFIFVADYSLIPFILPSMQLFCQLYL